MPKIATKSQSAAHIILWEDAEIPGFDRSCDVEIRVRFTALPAEHQTYWTPGLPAEAKIDRAEVTAVKLYSDCGEPLDVDGRTMVPEADVVIAFWAKHEESDIAEKCLESLA